MRIDSLLQGIMIYFLHRCGSGTQHSGVIWKAKEKGVFRARVE